VDAEANWVDRLRWSTKAARVPIGAGLSILEKNPLLPLNNLDQSTHLGPQACKNYKRCDEPKALATLTVVNTQEFI
jgi:hypothetical protein